MNQQLYRILFAASLLMLTAQLTTAQAWQWARRGGGPFDGSNVEPTEKIVDMATDQRGNVYALGTLSTSGSPNVDGHPVSGYGEKDIILTSFRCDGTYRWSRVIGRSGDDYPGSVGTDSLGHVYLTGMAYGRLFFDGDSIMPSSSYNKSIFLAQYDTAGTVKWVRRPSPDTASLLTTTSCKSLDMVVTGSGEVYWYALLMPGLVSGGNGWAVSSMNGYVLKYDVNGNITGHIDPQMDVSNAGFYYCHINRLPSGKLIIAGTTPNSLMGNTMTINGVPMVHSMFIAAFSSTGQYLWEKENTKTGISAFIYSRPLFDAQENVYLTGTAGADDSLNGYGFTNIVSSIPNATPFVTKMGINGNHLWTRSAGGTAVGLYNSIALKGNDEVWLSGTGASVWWDSTHKIQGQPNGGYFIYATRFNTANGAVLSMDSLKGTFGSRICPMASTTDRSANLYIGGLLDGDIIINGQTISKLGGASDFFLAKLGSATCNCTLPTAAFTKSANGRTITLTYSGSTAGVDSVVWNYGNGVTARKTGTAMSTAFTYTYPANGTYNLCVTAYGSCGPGQSCQSITVSGVGIGSAALSALKVYPNPAADFVLIEGAEAGTSAELDDLLGRTVATVEINNVKETLSLKGFAPGTYLLTLKDRSGARQTTRIVKQ